MSITQQIFRPPLPSNFKNSLRQPNVFFRLLCPIARQLIMTISDYVLS